MDNKEEEFITTTRPSPPPPNRLKQLVAALLAMSIASYFIYQSYGQPGGLLNGLKYWRTYPYLKDWFGEPYNPAYDNEEDIPLYDPDERDDIGGECQVILPTTRTVFGDTFTSVYGWPSTGGVYIKADCQGVELDFLGVSRLETTKTQRHTEPQAEDEFCQRLKWIGARYYKSDTDGNAFRSRHDYVRQPEFWVGWPGAVPEGGVWTLRIEGVIRNYDDYEYEPSEKSTSRIRNALTMQERCEAIKILGGTYHKNWQDAFNSDPFVVDSSNENETYEKMHDDEDSEYPDEKHLWDSLKRECN